MISLLLTRPQLQFILGYNYNIHLLYFFVIIIIIVSWCRLGQLLNEILP